MCTLVVCMCIITILLVFPKITLTNFSFREFQMMSKNRIASRQSFRAYNISWWWSILYKSSWRSPASHMNALLIDIDELGVILRCPLERKGGIIVGTRSPNMLLVLPSSLLYYCHCFEEKIQNNSLRLKHVQQVCLYFISLFSLIAICLISCGIVSFLLVSSTNLSEPTEYLTLNFVVINC